MNTFGKATALILLIVLLIALIGIGPVLTIMAMNALFNLSIGITFWNWLSVVWLSMVANGIATARYKSKE